MIKEVGNAIKKMKSDLHEMNSKYLSVLNIHEEEVKHSISEIKIEIAYLNKLLVSNDVISVSAHPEMLISEYCLLKLMLPYQLLTLRRSEKIRSIDNLVPCQRYQYMVTRWIIPVHSSRH